MLRIPGYRERSREQNFWLMVNKTSNCWLWKGSKLLNGYGDFVSHFKRQFAHRYSWELHHGKIPKKMCVCHRCDIRLCVNPEHLFLGTLADNLKDMWKKGRGKSNFSKNPQIVRGKNNVNAKLTSKIVRHIRKKYRFRDGEILAKKFKVTAGTITSIVNRKIWRWVK